MALMDGLVVTFEQMDRMLPHHAYIINKVCDSEIRRSDYI